MSRDVTYGERWLDRHFPDWRRLIRMDVDPGATEEDVEHAINYALKADPAEIGLLFLEVPWRMVHGDDGYPPHPTVRTQQSTANALVVIREVIGHVLHYAKELGEDPSDLLADVFREDPEL